MTEYPPPPSAADVTGHFELIGPHPTPSNQSPLNVCYRIIDRRTTTGDAYRFPGKEAEFIESTKVVMMMFTNLGDSPGVVETMFREFKRRLMYVAEQEWQHQCDAIRASKKTDAERAETPP